MEDEKLDKGPTEPAPAQDGDAASGQSGETSGEAGPHGTDWKSEARKWEKRAKENAAKADKWDAHEKDAPALEELRKQVESLKAEAEAAKADAAHRSLLADVSAATGVPASLIKGDTEEEMQASATAIAEFARSSGGFPADKGGGASSKPMTEDAIKGIADPVARVRARAETIKQNR